MKKASYHICFLLLVLYSLQISCHKDVTNAPTQLPPITQIGANTFGCKINGQVWVPYYPCSATYWNGISEMENHFHSIDSNSILPLGFGINVGNISGNQSFFSIGPVESGVYIHGTGNIIDSLGIDFIGGPGGWVYTNCSGCPESPSHIFQITKLDTVARIISGTFNFTLYGGSDSVIITEGRFDLQILPAYSRCSN